MTTYTREQIYKAVRDGVSPNISDKDLRRYIDWSIADAYINGRTKKFKDLLHITYEYYKNPNFKQLERLLEEQEDTYDYNMDFSDNDNFTI